MQVIFGDFDSTLKISFSSKENGRLYDIYVKRHVPIRTWEHVRRWYEVKEELVARGLCADIGIVDTLESMRLFVSDCTGQIKDLLNEGGRGKCTLGIQLAVNSRNSYLNQRQVQGVILGSSAHVVGNLMRGDEIVQVDGEPATGNNLQVSALLQLEHITLHVGNESALRSLTLLLSNMFKSRGLLCCVGIFDHKLLSHHVCCADDEFLLPDSSRKAQMHTSGSRWCDRLVYRHLVAKTNSTPEFGITDLFHQNGAQGDPERFLSSINTVETVCQKHQ